MSAVRSKLIVAVRVEVNTAFWCRPLASGSWSKATLDSGLYYISGDGGGDDLLTAIDAAVLAAIGVNTTWTIDNTTGIVTADRDTTGTVQIIETDPTDIDTDNATGVFVGDGSILRFTNSIAGEAGFGFTNTGVAAARTHRGGLYPSRARVRDYPRQAVIADETRPTDANRQVVSYPTRAGHDLEVSIKGVPTAVIFDEFDQLKDFLANAKTGRPLRYYRDRTIATVQTKTNPFGFSTWQANPRQCALDIDPTYGNYVRIWNKRFELWEYR